jgi:hypothetical protein
VPSARPGAAARQGWCSGSFRQARTAAQAISAGPVHRPHEIWCTPMPWCTNIVLVREDPRCDSGPFAVGCQRIQTDAGMLRPIIRLMTFHPIFASIRLGPTSAIMAPAALPVVGSMRCSRREMDRAAWLSLHLERLPSVWRNIGMTVGSSGAGCLATTVGRHLRGLRFGFCSHGPSANRPGRPAKRLAVH